MIAAEARRRAEENAQHIAKEKQNRDAQDKLMRHERFVRGALAQAEREIEKAVHAGSKIAYADLFGCPSPEAQQEVEIALHANGYRTSVYEGTGRNFAENTSWNVRKLQIEF